MADVCDHGHQGGPALDVRVPVLVRVDSHGNVTDPLLRREVVGGFGVHTQDVQPVKARLGAP